MPPLSHPHTRHTSSLQLHPHTHHIVAPGFVDRPRRSDCTAGQMDGEAGWWTTSGNIGLPPLARAMGVGRQQQHDSTFNILQFNIGNKLTELEVVLERNKVKVVVIHESKLSSKSKNPCIRNYTTVRKDHPHSHGGGLLVFIHESITFSKQPSSPEALSDPHLEELTIKADIGNTKLIISNIYIPPASSCSNGYQSSIEHLLTTLDTLILGDFNAHHLSWYKRSTDTRGKRMDNSINGYNFGILDWDSPTRVPPDVSWQTLSTLSSDHLPILIRLQMKTTSTQGLR